MEGLNIRQINNSLDRDWEKVDIIAEDIIAKNENTLSEEEKARSSMMVALYKDQEIASLLKADANRDEEDVRKFKPFYALTLAQEWKHRREKERIE